MYQYNHKAKRTHNKIQLNKIDSNNDDVLSDLELNIIYHEKQIAKCYNFLEKINILKDRSNNSAEVKIINQFITNLLYTIDFNSSILDTLNEH